MPCMGPGSPRGEKSLGTNYLLPLQNKLQKS